jgi:hypothetical protein
MSIGRRPLRGSPLLISAAGAVVTIACSGGAGRHPPGNLMAPPMIQVCVAATPPEAAVTVNGYAVDEQGCAGAYEQQMVTIDATLEGYEPYHEEYSPESELPHEIVLVPVATEPVEEPPVAE